MGTSIEDGLPGSLAEGHDAHQTAPHALETWASALPDEGVESHETANLALVGWVMAEAALRREESRGAHYRIDFPESRRQWRRRQLFVVRRRPMLRVHAIGEAGWADVEVLS